MPATHRIFADGFDLGNLCAWSQSPPEPDRDCLADLLSGLESAVTASDLEAVLLAVYGHLSPAYPLPDGVISAVDVAAGALAEIPQAKGAYLRLRAVHDAADFATGGNLITVETFLPILKDALAAAYANPEDRRSAALVLTFNASSSGDFVDPASLTEDSPLTFVGSLFYPFVLHELLNAARRMPAAGSVLGSKLLPLSCEDEVVAHQYLMKSAASFRLFVSEIVLNVFTIAKGVFLDIPVSCTLPIPTLPDVLLEAGDCAVIGIKNLIDVDVVPGMCTPIAGDASDIMTTCLLQSIPCVGDLLAVGQAANDLWNLSNKIEDVMCVIEENHSITPECDCTECESTVDFPCPLGLFCDVLGTVPDIYCECPVTVTKIGSGTGAVSSVPQGIDCGPACASGEAVFPENTLVLLEPQPANAPDFGGWFGDEVCSDGVFAVSGDQAIHCIAFFPGRVHLTVGKEHDIHSLGDVTLSADVPGIDCGDDCEEELWQGTKVTLTATPDSARSLFLDWQGAQSDPDCFDSTVTLDVDKTCVARVSGLFEVSVGKAGSGGGTVVSDPPGISCGDDCSALFPGDSTVTLSATAAADSTFGGEAASAAQVGWLGASCPAKHTTNASFPAWVQGDFHCDANFLKNYLVSVEVVGPGRVIGGLNGVDGIRCGLGATDCSEIVYDTGYVPLILETTSGCFSDWSGDCTSFFPDQGDVYVDGSDQFCRVEIEDDPCLCSGICPER